MSGTLRISPLYELAKRDLRLAMRRKSDMLTSLSFFVIVVSLFPLAIGAERDTLRQIAPGILWVAALLATMMSLNQLFEQDYVDGTLEQLLLSPSPLGMLVLGKLIAHWLLTGLPLTLLAPFLALQFDLPASSLLILSLSFLIGTPVLSLIGAIGASLTLGLRGGGVLLALIILPLYTPVLIFGTGAVVNAAVGLSASANLSLLAAMLAVAIFFSPLAIAAALKIALE
ncbi:MAG: heme exporter protein CcmB [Burkholderiaceae bacterium]